jgi:hypothetical protein
MSIRRIILLAGAALLLAGIVALLVPTSIPGSDGSSIGCGNAVFEDLSGARAANASSIANVPILNQVVPHTDFVAQCESAISSRRTWSIPLAVLGIVVTAGSVISGRGAQNRVQA